MKKKFLKNVISIVLAATFMISIVPVSAATPEAKVSSMKQTEDVILEVKKDTLKSIDTCVPTYVSTGLDENEYYRLTPGYGIEQHDGIVLFVQCEHGSGYVTVKESMCSGYRTDLIDEIQEVTVTYNGVPVILPIMYQYPMNFTDVSESDWFYDSVDFMNGNKIMTGMTSTYFGAYEPLSRAQFALILYRLEASPEYTSTKTFPDVPAGCWYEDAVLWAYENNIITGYLNGYFGASDYITREQMAVMLYRYVNAFIPVSGQADLGKYADGSYVSPFAVDAVSWAVSEGIISGKDNGTRIAPQENTARAECAVITQRFVTWINDTFK